MNKNVSDWTEKDHARWDKACGIDEQEIKRRAKERREQKKLAATTVNPYEHICEHCGVTFGARFPYRYCGTINGCLQDESGDTKKEVQKHLAAGESDDN